MGKVRGWVRCVGGYCGGIVTAARDIVCNKWMQAAQKKRIRMSALREKLVGI